VIGTLVNAGAIAGGAGLGVALGGRIDDRVRRVMTDAVGVFVVVLGVNDALVTFGPELAGPLGRGAVLLVLGSLVVGGALGAAIDVEGRLERLGERLRRLARRRSGGTGADADPDPDSAADSAVARQRFIEGFVVTSLIVLVGPLAILGPLREGLLGDWQLLAVKSVLDGVVAVAFAGIYGIGVAFAALPLLVWQGMFWLAAVGIGAVVPDPAVTALTAVGGVLVTGIGLRILEVRPVPVADLMPALLIAPAAVVLLV
jgi:uncharacterized membrane protein YqgA involved in biofilm formation